MEQTGATTSAAGGAEVELRCPLCEYDVRGLPEPRCPECGCEFTWEELTNPARSRQLWLFEHRRRREGYGSTQARLLLPWRFWATLRPAHRLDVRRMLIFYAIGWAMTLGVWGALVLPEPVIRNWDDARIPPGSVTTRAAMWPVPNQMMMTATGPMTWQQFAKANNIVLPPTPPAVVALSRSSPAYWLNLGRLVWGEISNKRGYVAVGVFSARWLPAPSPRSAMEFAVAVATAVAVVMLVMRQSFARAKIMWGHAVRVVVYSTDVAGLAVLLVVGCGLRFLASKDVTTGQLSSVMVLAAGGFALWSLVRFNIAVRKYLGTPRSALVVGATALIAVLLWIAMAVIE